MKLIYVLLAVCVGAAPALAQQAKLQGKQMCRDAITGKTVTEAYAKKHPKTTTCEQR